MPETAQKFSRRNQILQALAYMLEASPGERITTAGLAKEVGVSEAALYRHFPSKTKMFEGLIMFIEESVFTLVNKIIKEEQSALSQCEKMLTVLLRFSEKNPGITRILTGDALAGEPERLRIRIRQFFDRLELQLKQVLKEAEMREGVGTTLSPSLSANLLLATAEGRISQFVRSEFKQSPTLYWDEQWSYLARNLFLESVAVTS